MKDFQRQKGWRNIMESWPVLVFLAALLLFFAWGVIGFWGKMKETGKNKEIAENKLAQLEKSKVEFGSNIEKLKTDEGVEESIREKFGLAKEGEDIIVVVEDKNPPTDEEASSGGFFSFLKNLFK